MPDPLKPKAKLRAVQVIKMKELYRHLVENSMDAIVLTEPGGRISFANPAACRLFEMTEKELLQGGRQSVIDPNEGSLETAMDILKRECRFLGEIRCRRKNGTLFPAEISASPFTDSNGDMKVACVVRDITARKQMETALTESDVRYRELFNQMNSGVAIYQPINDGCDFIIRGLNPAAERMLRVRRESVLGKSIFTVWPGVREFGLIRYFKKVRESGKPVFAPEAFYRDETLSGWFENKIYPLPSGEIFTVFENVTDRKKYLDALSESEAKFRLITETVNEGLALFSAEGKILSWNKAAEWITGISSEEVMEKEPDQIDWKAVNEDGSPCPFKELPPLEAIRTGLPQTNRIIGSTRTPGQIRWTSVTAIPLFDPGDEEPRLVGVSFSDVTETKNYKEQLETRIHKRTEQLEEMNAALKVLLSKRESDLEDIGEKISGNCKNIIMPLLNRLKTSSENQDQKMIISVIEQSLTDILSPFARQLTRPMERLTPAEIQISAMITQGLSNKEIALALNNSVRTITNHRDNIRKKLGLRNKKVNLRSYLSSL